MIRKLLCAAAVLGAALQAGLAAELPLMPWPATVSVEPGALPITGDFTLALTGAGANDERVQAAAARVLPRLFAQTGIFLRANTATGTAATLLIDVTAPDHSAPQRLGDDEHYTLKVTPQSARLTASHPLGALRGLETFLQLVQQNTTPVSGQSLQPGFSVQAVSVDDSPRFAWRGLSFDVSRHFIPAADVERTLDGMAAVKLNVLHWHLSDDQGFRIESKKFPKLHRLGSEGQYYTQAEVRHILSYARDRGIRVVPEFDMPGHAASFLPGAPFLAAGPGPYGVGQTYGILTQLIDPTKESTYQFLDAFIGEMTALFPDQYFHIGGDEVKPAEWDQNPAIVAFRKTHNLPDDKALQTYFNQRIFKIVTKHGKRMEGWDEVLNPELPKTIVIQSWRGQSSLWQAAAEGYDGILSAGYYLDLMQPTSQHYAIDPMKLPPPSKDDEATPQKVPPALTEQSSKHILGGEAAMWEELATSENVDAKLWPRLAAVAERLWSPETVTDVESMYQRLHATDHWLEYLGLQQKSELVLMRQRLAGDMPVAPLDRFASILEPLKGYDRDSEKYKTTTPLNRLVDSIAPESETARRFRVQVDEFVQAVGPERNSERLRQQLTQWRQDAQAVRPMLERNSLLRENLPVADAITTVTTIGEEALTYLQAGKPAPAEWTARSREAVDPLVNGKIGDLLVQIAPGVQKLVGAAGGQP